MLGFIDRVAWGRANISEHLEHWKQFFSNFFKDCFILEGDDKEIPYIP